MLISVKLKTKYTFLCTICDRTRTTQIPILSYRVFMKAGSEIYYSH